jgi:hypothetical protein
MCDVTELRDLTVSLSRAPEDKSRAISVSGGLRETEEEDTFRRDSPWSPVDSWMILLGADDGADGGGNVCGVLRWDDDDCGCQYIWCWPAWMTGIGLVTILAREFRDS